MSKMSSIGIRVEWVGVEEARVLDMGMGVAVDGLGGERER